MELSGSSSTQCCIVCSLLNKKFSARNFKEQLTILEKGRPKPTLYQLTNKIKTCTRYFQTDLYEQYEWLTGCETECKLFCWPCLLFQEDIGVWNRHGFCDLTNIHRAIKKHTLSQPHLQLVIKEKLFGKSGIEHVIDEQLKVNHRKHNELVEKNRAVLKRLIEVIFFLVTHELGCRCHECSTSTNERNFVDLVSLLSSCDVALKNHLEQLAVLEATSNSIQNDLISATATVVLRKVKLDIKKTRFVAIILDETNTSQLSVVLRYVSEGGIQERFLGFIGITADRRTKTLHQIVCNFIAEAEFGDKLVAQSYDGSVVMAAELGDLQAKVKKRFPNALPVHCFGHQLHLILSQSLAHIKECKLFFSTLIGMAAFFSTSAKRMQALDLIMQKRLLNVAPGQWNYNGSFVGTVYQYRLPLIELFQNILENNSDWDTETLNSSKGYLEYLKRDFTFNFLLNVFSEIFPFCDELIEILQNKLNDIEHCVEKIKEFKNNIIHSERCGFETVWEKTIQEGDLEPSRKRLRTESVGDVTIPYRILLTEIIDQIYGQISNRFENFSDLRFLELCNFNGFKNTLFPNAAFQSFVRHYGDYFDVPSLHAELAAIYTTEDIHSKNDPRELLNFLKQTGLHNAYHEAQKFCELVLTIPATSFSMEHNFSVLKRVKNFMKNSTSECGLSELSLLSIEKDLLKQLSDDPSFYDDVIEEFAKKNKKIELHYSSFFKPSLSEQEVPIRSDKNVMD